MKLLSFLVRYSPRLLLFAVLTGIVSGAASAALMALINQTLASSGEATTAFALPFMGVTLVVLTASLGSRLLLLRLSTQAVLKMRLHLCKQMLGAPLRQLEEHGSPRLMAALTEDILAVSDTLAELPLLFINIAVISACLAYLGWLSWPLMLCYLAVFAIGVVAYQLIERRTLPHLRKGREKWDALIGYYQALIYGNKELKLHRARRRDFIADGVEPTAMEMQRLSLRWHTLFAVASSYGQVFYFLVIGGILFAAPQFGRFDFAVLSGFTLLTVYMNGPISFIIGTLPSFQRAEVSLQKIDSLGLSLESSGRPEDPVEDYPQAAAFVGLEVRGLTYAYRHEEDDRTFTLGPLDFSLRPGELVFVIGGNGSGKSSFARLLTGLYIPDGGAVAYNGEPVTDANRDRYRQNFSAVFSDYYLFDTLFGLLTPDLAERVAAYLEKLRLARKVRVVDGRFSTTELSQGQRKRLALLTAFVENRHIYLFDEWAADQDPTFKEVFYMQILPELQARGKTVVVISHDEHYYHVADRIVKFEDGRIIEDRANPARAIDVAPSAGATVGELQREPAVG